MHASPPLHCTRRHQECDRCSRCRTSYAGSLPRSWHWTRCRSALQYCPETHRLTSCVPCDVCGEQYLEQHGETTVTGKRTPCLLFCVGMPRPSCPCSCGAFGTRPARAVHLKITNEKVIPRSRLAAGEKPDSLHCKFADVCVLSHAHVDQARHSADVQHLAGTPAPSRSFRQSEVQLCAPCDIFWL